MGQNAEFRLGYVFVPDIHLFRSFFSVFSVCFRGQSFSILAFARSNRLPADAEVLEAKRAQFRGIV